MYARVASCTVLGLPSVLPSARSVTNAGGVSPIQPVCILKLLSGDAVILRSEPSSRAALMGEQPNPWDLSLPPLLVGQDYTFTMAISCHHERFRCEPCDRCHIDLLNLSHRSSKEVLPRISRYGRRIPGSLPRCSGAVLSIGHSARPMYLPVQQ